VPLVYMLCLPFFQCKSSIISHITERVCDCMLIGLVRESSVAQSEFVSQDGFSVLLRAMQSDVEKLQTKSAFLTSAFCQQQPRFTGHIITSSQ